MIATANCFGDSGREGERTPGERLVERLEGLARLAGLPRTLQELGVPRDSLSMLAAEAAQQWTGTFNPRSFDERGALELYEAAY